jgi:cytidine deaminase
MNNIDNIADADGAADARRLVAAARAAALNAHAPYSRFAVGAALLMTDGSLITGANVENASYGLSLCAETVAIATASAAGRLREIVAIGVIGGAMDADGRATGTSPVSPCGRCRQVINEAAQLGGRDLPVHCGAAEGDAITSDRLSELLPAAFGPADLGIG